MLDMYGWEEQLQGESWKLKIILGIYDIFVIKRMFYLIIFWYFVSLIVLLLFDMIVFNILYKNIRSNKWESY